MDHHVNAGSSGEMPGFEDRYTRGARPISFYIPRYRNISAATRRSDFLRGYGIEGDAKRLSWKRGIAQPGFGAELKKTLREPGPWHVEMDGFGEMLPRYENYVHLDPTRVDPYGIPQLAFHYEWG